MKTQRVAILALAGILAMVLLVGAYSGFGDGGFVWGKGYGTLSSQTDLQAALDAKGTGTVTSASVTTANGVSAIVATATTTPAFTFTLGSITPTSVNGVTLSGSSTPSLAVTGTTMVSGANTGDQSTVSGNAGTATTLQTPRTINGVSFNGSANITVTAAGSTLSDPVTFSNGASTGSAATSATTGTMTVNMTTSIVTITPSGACTFNGSGGVTGQICTFVITTSGVSSFTLTWGTNYKTTATLATGTTTAKIFTVTFRCTNGTQWAEMCRTAAQ